MTSSQIAAAAFFFFTYCTLTSRRGGNRTCALANSYINWKNSYCRHYERQLINFPLGETLINHHE